MNLYEMIFFEEGGRTYRTQFVEDNDENAKKQTMADDKQCKHILLLKHNKARIHHYKWEVVGTKKFNPANDKFEWENFDGSKYENHTEASDKH